MNRQEWYSCTGAIVRGVLVLSDRQGFLDAMKRFPECDVSVDVKIEKPTRTSAQNRFYHGVVIPLFAQHCGYDVAEMKDALALHLIPKDITDFQTGVTTTVPGHTSQLTVAEFADLIERAQRLGAEMGIVIPDPEEFSHGD